MEKSAEEVLDEEYARLMGRSARAGSLLGGGLGFLLPGHERRAKEATRRLPIDVYEAQVQVPQDVNGARRQLTEALTGMGRVIGDDVQPERARVRAVLPSGMGGLNPAVLDTTLVPVATGTAVTLTGMVKDSTIGLFKQRGGEKVVKKVLATLGWQETS